MSKTHRFNTTVSLGVKSFPPGADVPLGGKNGLSPEEVSKLENEFGVWKGGENSARPDGQAALLNAALEKEAEVLAHRVEEQQKKLVETAGERDALASEKTALAARVEELERLHREASAERDAFAEDNQLLADRVKELEAAAAGEGGGGNGEKA